MCWIINCFIWKPPTQKNVMQLKISTRVWGCWFKSFPLVCEEYFFYRIWVSTCTAKFALYSDYYMSV